MIQVDRYGLIDGTRDKAHNAAFYAIACHSSKIPCYEMEALNYMFPVKNILFNSVFYPIKDYSYFWSNSGSQNEQENTFFTRFTYVLYQKVLKKVGFNPHKGSNPDQIYPVSIYCLLFKDYKFALKLLLGFVLRLGFYPNGEHLIFKPHHLMPFLRLFKLGFLGWLLDLFFFIGVWLEDDKPFDETTNKIKDFIYLVSYKRANVWTYLSKRLYKRMAYDSRHFSQETYWKQIFTIYFGENHDITKTMNYRAIIK